MKRFPFMVFRVVVSLALCSGCPAWPQSIKATGPGSFLPIDGGQIYFEECGTSPQTLVLVHDGVLDSGVWDDVWPEFCRHFHTIRYDEIRVPTLLLVGDADIPDVHAHAGAIGAGIPRARRVVVSGVGHLMYLEKPAEFSRLAIAFIEQNKSTEWRAGPASS